jgi:hypothetical protein
MASRAVAHGATGFVYRPRAAGFRAGTSSLENHHHTEGRPGLSDIDDAERRVAASLDEVRRTLSAAGVKYVDAGGFVMGSGVAVAWSETFYAILSIANFLDQQLNITYGVLRHINQDRLAALEFCNLHNQNMAAYPTYLHDAENGWDILQQNVLPLQILLEAPQFVLGFYLDGSSQTVDDLRAKAAERNLGGEPCRWNSDDVHRLLAKSLM